VDAISLVSAAIAITVFATVLLLFVVYWVNQTVLKNLAAAQASQQIATALLQVVQQLYHKQEAENENNRA
jgi:CHASE3 domain sensor protein